MLNETTCPDKSGKSRFAGKKHILFLMSFLFLLPCSIIAQQKSMWDRIPEDIKQTKPYQRFEWFYKQRAFPYDTIPQYRYIEIVER